MSLDRWPKIKASVLFWANQYPEPARLRFVVSRNAEDDRRRHLAATRWDRKHVTVFLSPRLERMGKAKRDAVLLHELGHVLAGAPGARMTDDEIEREADRCAEEAFKVTISYDPIDRVQTLGAGVRPRPSGLL